MEHMIVIRSEKVKYNPLQKEARRIARGVLRAMNAEMAYLEIYLIDEAKMKRINRLFRRKNKPTNVLSFPPPSGFPEPQTKLRVLGEVYLSPGYITRKGEGFGAMVIHGILHLFGYDHIKNRDRIRMEKLERSLYRAMKIKTPGRGDKSHG